jgi:Leucine rich repeat
LPREVFAMIDLRYFSIENNQISGDIPDLLVSWKDLEFFNARKNRLSGSIPSYIGDLHKLQQVDLSGNLITGKIPATMGGLKDLRTLRVENNQMAGTFVDDLDSCRSKRGVELSSHLGLRLPCSGTVPKLVCKLTEANDLSLLTCDCKNGSIVCDCCHKCY